MNVRGLGRRLLDTEVSHTSLAPEILGFDLANSPDSIGPEEPEVGIGAMAAVLESRVMSELVVVSVAETCLVKMKDRFSVAWESDYNCSAPRRPSCRAHGESGCDFHHPLHLVPTRGSAWQRGRFRIHRHLRRRRVDPVSRAKGS